MEGTLDEINEFDAKRLQSYVCGRNMVTKKGRALMVSSAHAPFCVAWDRHQTHATHPFS
jgi:hypothetical protein